MSPIEEDEHLLTVLRYTVLRYVERNALRANLLEGAEGWERCSLWRRGHAEELESDFLSDWPIHRSRQWVSHVNNAQSEQQLAAICQSLKHGTQLAMLTG